MTTLALPTHKAEDWRYSDIDAVAAAWPPAEPVRISVAAGEGARHHLLQQTADGATAIHDYVIDIAAGGSCELHLLNIGGKLGRIAIDVTLHKGAHFSLGGVNIGGGEQTLEIVTTVTHAEPEATSRQTIRSILANHAVGTYLGKVCVARDAQLTDSEQSVKAMLLDRTATANARPELEIFADDVKCAHGATVGELDKMALFYMESRGLDPATARTLLLRAFVAGVFTDIGDEVVREQFEAAALAKLESLTGSAA